LQQKPAQIQIQVKSIYYMIMVTAAWTAAKE